MGEEIGLASRMQSQNEGPGIQEMVQKVAELLAQGVSPEELIAKGIPEQVIQMAMQMIQSQQETQQVPEQPRQVMPPEGLAGRGMM